MVARAAGAFPRASPTMAGFGTIEREGCHALLEDAACVVVVILVAAGDIAIVDEVGTGEGSREVVVE